MLEELRFSPRKPSQPSPSYDCNPFLDESVTDGIAARTNPEVGRY